MLRKCLRGCPEAVPHCTECPERSVGMYVTGQPGERRDGQGACGRRPRLVWLVVGAGLALGACETTDPCVRRQAACLDVDLTGRPEPAYYRGVTVTVAQADGSPLVSPERIEELRPTAFAATQARITYRLPDSFNQLMDIKPDKIIGELNKDDEKIQRLEQLRAMDPRAIRIVVEGTEVNGGEMIPVRWDSLKEEELRLQAAKQMGNPDPWLRLGYFRLGHNQYLSIPVPLCRVARMSADPMMSRTTDPGCPPSE